MAPGRRSPVHKHPLWGPEGSTTFVAFYLYRKKKINAPQYESQSWQVNYASVCLENTVINTAEIAVNALNFWNIRWIKKSNRKAYLDGILMKMNEKQKMGDDN